MAEIVLNIEVSEEGTLEDDLSKYLKGELNGLIETALQDVGADMRGALAKHVESDVYGRYKPKVYERRGENGGLIAQARNATIYPHGSTGLAIEFKPDGNHPAVAGWSDKSGDDLIGRIERHDPEYKWLPKKGEIPNRPFWQNFVDEMVDDGELERYFVAAMQMHGVDGIEADGELTRDAGDGGY